MVKRLLSVLAVAAMAINLSSCLDTNRHEMTQTLSDEIIVVTNNGEDYTATKGRIALKINVNEATARLTMPVLVGGETKIAEFKDLKVKYDFARGYCFSATSAQALDANDKSMGFSVDNLDGFLQVGEMIDATHDNIGVNYRLNGKTVFASKNEISHPYTTTLTSMGSTGYECKDAVYTFRINLEKKTADIIINKIRFVEESPILSEITIPGVPYTYTPTGYHFEAEKIVPSSDGVPMDKRTVTNLDMTVKVQEGVFSGMFRCMGMLCTANGTLAKKIENQQ